MGPGTGEPATEIALERRAGGVAEGLEGLGESGDRGQGTQTVGIERSPESALRPGGLGASDGAQAGPGAYRASGRPAGEIDKTGGFSMIRFIDSIYVPVSFLLVDL